MNWPSYRNLEPNKNTNKFTLDVIITFYVHRVTVMTLYPMLFDSFDCLRDRLKHVYN